MLPIHLFFGHFDVNTKHLDRLFWKYSNLKLRWKSVYYLRFRFVRVV